MEEASVGRGNAFVGADAASDEDENVDVLIRRLEVDGWEAVEARGLVDTDEA